MRASIRRVTLAFLVFGTVIFAVRAAASQSFVRQFNKHILNPFAPWLVARRPMYCGVIHHVGRRSGRCYSTPVVAKLTTNGVIIPLPYGADTGWCRNLLAAGRGTLTLAGRDYSVETPTIVDATIAGALVPVATACVWRRMGIEKYLQLKEERLADTPLAAAASSAQFKQA